MHIAKKHIEFVEQNFSAEKLKHFIENIYKTDHYPSFWKFHQTADWVVEELKSYGVQAKKIEIIADGKTKYGDWLMPKAWDARDLKLTDLSNNEVIADYQTLPAHMIMGSGATPPEGFTAEVIYLSNPEEFATKDIRGKFVLSKFNPQGFKKIAFERGALAFLFHGVVEDFQGDYVRWVNSWSDDTSMWAPTAYDYEYPGVSLSPNMVDKYKEKLDKGEVVKFHLMIDTNTYDGTLPIVEAFIPGQEKDEAFFTGHLYEQGANDNASGCATMMEMARIFSKVKPKKGLRFLFTSELYGTIPYSYDNLDILDNAFIGLNIDSTAEVARKSQKMEVVQNPNTSPSFVNLLLKDIVKVLNVEDQFHFTGFILDDNMVTDPQINIPCALVGVCSLNWHTSNDTLDILDWDLFNLTTKLCAIWASVVTTGGQDEAKHLKDLVAEYEIEFSSSMQNKKALPEFEVFKQDYIKETINGYYASVNKIHQVQDIEPLVYEEHGPVRNYFGPPCYRLVDKQDRQRMSMWNCGILYPQFFCNGFRSKSRVLAYASLEFKNGKGTDLSLLKWLYKFNYISDFHSTNSLKIDLKRIGIKPGDIIIMHGSMKSIGRPVDGGPEAVLEAILDVIGNTGTLVVATFTQWEHKNDLRTEPSRLGLLAETFRKWPGAIRSNNPTHAVSAIGKHAEEIINGHENTTQLGIDSPLHKAAKLGAKVLHLGTKLKSCSIIHVAEVIAKVPYLHIGYHNNVGPIEYINSNGEEMALASNEQPGDSNGFHKIFNHTDLELRLKRNKIGSASSFLVKADDLIECALQTIKKDPYSILCDNPKCTVCTTSKECK